MSCLDEQRGLVRVVVFCRCGRFIESETGRNGMKHTDITFSFFTAIADLRVSGFMCAMVDTIEKSAQYLVRFFRRLSVICGYSVVANHRLRTINPFNSRCDDFQIDREAHEADYHW